jgi:co-chaperonin GroES (HSP10)
MSEVTNTSGLRPLGRAVLVAPYNPEIKKGSIILPDQVQLGQEIAEQRAIVIESGCACWAEEIKAGFGPRAKPGDKVLISGYAGHMAKGTADGKQYRLIHDKDIFARIEVES